MLTTTCRVGERVLSAQRNLISTLIPMFSVPNYCPELAARIAFRCLLLVPPQTPYSISLSMA